MYTSERSKNPGPARQQASTRHPKDRQQHGSSEDRYSLLQRLKSDRIEEPEPEPVREQPTPPREQKFLDPTAAFFGRHARLRGGPVGTPHTTTTLAAAAPRSLLGSGAPRRPWQEEEKVVMDRDLLVRELKPREQRRQSSLRDVQRQDAAVVAVSLPLVEDLRQSIADTGDRICIDAVGKLEQLHKGLARDVAGIKAEDDRVLAPLEAAHKKMAKPLSDIVMSMVVVDGHGDESREDIHLGEHVACVKKRLDAVDAEIESLWDRWEASQRDFDAVFAEVMGGRDADANAVGAVRDSLAVELQKFEDELGTVLEDAYEEARVTEKNFSKKINGVMSALLQQYLMKD